MSPWTRRNLLAALASLGAGAAVAGAPAIKPQAAKRIGAAWLATQAKAPSAAALAAELLPAGWSDAALEALSRRVRADFRRGAVFAWNGWRLSDTEGRLFALLALAR